MDATISRDVKLEGAAPAAVNRRIRTKFYSAEHIRVSDILAMHQVFTQYYGNADLGTFFRDLAKKDGAFIVRERGTGRIKGFSTLKKMTLAYRGREVAGYFSGDTILERDIWGGTQLHNAFIRYMLKEKLRHFGRPIYWFLISKGYKTYLLLANNFIEYYPRHDRPQNNRLQELAEEYCRQLYPDNYDPQQRLLVFGEGAQHLQPDVAPITEELRSKHPKIRFFEQVNPGWQQGTELPCVGEIDFRTALAAIKKFSRRTLSRLLRQSPGGRWASSEGGRG